MTWTQRYRICLQCRRYRRCRFDPWVGKIPWRRSQQATPVFLMENPMDRGTWQVKVHSITKSQTWQKHWSMHTQRRLGLPWWLSGKESTCQCRRRGFHPWARKIPHALELCAKTVEPLLWSPGAIQPMLCNKWSHCNQKPAHRNKRVASVPRKTPKRPKVNI